MIDPLQTLAFTIQSNPGVYAVLLGSGVSRSAQIPTGWDITRDLVRRLAAVVGEECGEHPEVWFQQKYGKEPGYSDLLDMLAKTKAERQQIIRAYIEPSETDRAEGHKAPTAAHRAIAALASKGYIRVIITTNFDRLMETALGDVGIVPTVISSEDQITGAMPLVHTGCCVLKLHGDYFDTRILNTTSELAKYSHKRNALLNRIFDEFGLIVCGWSGEWDTALRNAIERAVSRRFSHFWAVRGETGNAAQRLIEHRQAQKILISDADKFFTELEQQVDALEQFSRPHPLSADIAIARLKKYLSEPKYRIQFDDLVSSEVDRVHKTIHSPNFSTSSETIQEAAFTAIIRKYESTCTILISMATVGGFWAEDWQYKTWELALARLATRQNNTMILQPYPGVLLLYALGISVVIAGESRLSFLGQLFATSVSDEYQTEKSILEILTPIKFFNNTGHSAQNLEGMNKHLMPLNDWIHNLLLPQFQSLIASDTKFTYIFDTFEILISLNYAYHSQRSQNNYWTPLGSYSYRHNNNSTRILKAISTSINAQGDNSPYVTSHIFGHTAEECTAQLDLFSKWLQELSRNRGW